MGAVGSALAGRGAADVGSWAVESPSGTYEYEDSQSYVESVDFAEVQWAIPARRSI
jgi:hypothetical protein